MVFPDAKRRTALVAALLLIPVYLVAGYLPFHLKTAPYNQRHNGAVVLPDGAIDFGTPGMAYTPAPPAWLQDVIATSRFGVSLQIRSADPAQHGPARIFTLSSDWNHRNVTIGQYGPHLVVTIRRPFSSENGTPPHSVLNVFASPEWHQVDVRVTPEFIEILVDGESPVVAAMPEPPLQHWNPTYRIALGNELTGNQPWLGTIRKAVVHTPAGITDYLAPGTLSIPERFTYMNDPPAKLIPFVGLQRSWATARDWTINLLGFVPFGWLVAAWRRPRPGILLATLWAAGISMTIEAGQLWIFAGRTPSTEDVIMNTLGAALGAWFAVRLPRQSETG
jgi:hypothetical protein